MKNIKVNIAKGFDKVEPLFKPSSYEERLNKVERLRLEAGKFLYEYPARL